MRTILFILWVIGASLAGAVDAPTPSVASEFLPAIPGGYYLQTYEDCGVDGRQPHVLMKDCYLWTFNTSDTDAGPKERSAVFSYKGIQAIYTNLDPKVSYVLALTYASDHVYKRVQSLEGDGVELHGPYALPKAKATRVIVKVPAEVTRDGGMALSWKIHGEVNATVSIIELWADKPTTNSLQITSIAGLMGSLQGQVLDLAFEPIIGAHVSLSAASSNELLTTNTGPEGIFSFSGKESKTLAREGELVLRAEHRGQEGSLRLNTAGLFFEPVHYRPLPEKTAGLNRNCFLLDGAWLVKVAPTNNVRGRASSRPGWVPFDVPGQFLQQGYDVPQDQIILAGKEFVIPSAWKGSRIILRFDAIHAGTRYWLNGLALGYSENLYTPVEWDITEAAAPGRTNRLELEMKVATVSEALSYSSAYAFHNLGGIDRSVRVFALPPTHIREMHVSAELGKDYRDGDLRMHLLLSGGKELEKDLLLAIKLVAPNGKIVKHSVAMAAVQPFIGPKVVDVVTHVNSPLQWSAEKPHLYRLVLELRRGKSVLERIERSIGFRKIEIRGSQLYVNGQRIKIAGACHHEFDPLTGRANTARHAEADVRLLKEANLNYIRTSHYPPTAELLDAADRLGMYVEVEAPFCWVGGGLDNPTNLLATLTPTSAMVDYHHSHPSVLVWSIANESHFNLQFLAAARLLKELDPTRPTTFNHDFASSPLARITDIANWHYPPWPFDSVFAGDSRPLFFGEYFFPICHEQTDVRINPGLRELWGGGHAEPDSVFGRACAVEFDKPPLKPGLKPGGWSQLYHSERGIGGAIWASHDDAFYFSETNHAGYAWHHGFWGLIDYWRRPKPEWWLSRHIFSPVWLETRHVGFVPGQKTIRVPVENRYAFTDLRELKFDWQIKRQRAAKPEEPKVESRGSRAGTVRGTRWNASLPDFLAARELVGRERWRGRSEPCLAPGARGELEIPIPPGTAEGDKLLLRIASASGVLIDESVIHLGKEREAALPRASAGAPRWSDDGNKVVIEGKGFSAVFDRLKGDFDPGDRRHKCAAMSFPTVHVTRYDFGDLNGPNSPPYAVFPDAKTSQVEKVEIKEEPSGLRITVYERYEGFAGSTSWLFEKDGRGVVSCDYTYSGKAMDTREAGIRLLMKAACDEVTWRRWSEWGTFPPESISRTEGSAKAHRDKKWGAARWDQRPSWPWSMDETELGTADFRSIKFNIYEAGLVSRDGSGFSVQANADAHFRAALAPGGVAAHLLWRCPLGQVTLKAGDRLRGEFGVVLHAGH